MSRNETKRIIAVAGRLGSTPEINGTDYGDVLNFRLAVTNSYDDDAEATWFDVSVWNEGLIDACEKDLEKGSAVAVEGVYTTRESGGKEYKKLSASRVGLVDYFQRSKDDRDDKKPAKASSKRRSSRDDDDDEDDEEEKPRRKSSSRSTKSTAAPRRAAKDDTDDDDLPF